MTPADIESKEFKVTRFREGYDLDEVDEFLDRVAEYMRHVEQTLHEERQRVTRLKSELATANRKLEEHADAPTMQIPMNATRILEAAQRTADDVIAEAQKQALDITARAEENAQATTNEAQAKARVATNEALVKVQEAETQLASLRARRDDLRGRMTEALRAITEQMGDSDGEGR